MARGLKILLASAEVAPIAKVGGLADVAGALPRALRALGHDVRVVMPAYPMVTEAPCTPGRAVLPGFPVPLGCGRTETARVRQAALEGDVPVYLVGSPKYFSTATESRGIYVHEPDPYAFFGRAVAEMVPRLPGGWQPDVLHANDWHTGLVPVYVRASMGGAPAWSRCASVFTVHNLAYHGDFPREAFQCTGLPERLFTFESLEFHGRMSFIKGGLTCSDMTNTVSETYAREIQTPEYGCGLDGLMRHLAGQHRLRGIVNGIDYAVFDPATDPAIATNYAAEDPSGKARCRTALRRECGLPASRGTALVGMVTRLADQKGFDIIAAAAERILAMPVQLVVLGLGDPRYETMLTVLSERHPEQVRVFVRFDTPLAQRIYAGSDMFLMPSRFEPCGLGQLIALRYGTLPVVRATGGLADTVIDADADPDRGNGFVFEPYTPEALLDALRRAVAALRKRDRWACLVRRAMRLDHSWKAPAARYVELYEAALRRAAAGRG